VIQSNPKVPVEKVTMAVAKQYLQQKRQLVRIHVLAQRHPGHVGEKFEELFTMISITGTEW
jgi:hypothetical protein